MSLAEHYGGIVYEYLDESNRNNNPWNTNDDIYIATELSLPNVVRGVAFLIGSGRASHAVFRYSQKVSENEIWTGPHSPELYEMANPEIIIRTSILLPGVDFEYVPDDFVV